MTLTTEQIKDLKEQLKQQASSLPQNKKAAALNQIDSLSPQALEAMLKQQGTTGKASDKGVFRMIVDSDIPSTKVEETKDCLAVLDINPISKGHVIIISKEQAKDVKKLPNSALALAKKIAKRITKKLNAKNIEIQTEFKFGEVIVNVIPFYDSPVSINSPRTKSSPEELEKIAYLIRKVQRKKIEKIKIKPSIIEKDQIQKVKRRIP